MFGLAQFPEGIPLKQTGVDLPALPLDIHTGAPNILDQQAKTQRDDNEGWITGQHAVNTSCTQDSQHPSPNRQLKIVSPTIQDGGVVSPLVQGQRTMPAGVSLKLPANTVEERGRKDTAPLRDENSKPQMTEGQIAKPSRLMSNLRPTSADFKPRMGVELKLPVAEFKPSRIDLNSQATYDNNHHPAERVVTANRSISTQNETSHPFQSNCALADHEFQLLKQIPGCLGDSSYLNKLLPQDGGINHLSLHADERQILDDRFLQPEDTQSGSFDDSYKMPNVYINVLPPHFPEDQLYALSALF